MAGLVDGLEPHLPPLSSQKNDMLIFGLCSTSDDRPRWSLKPCLPPLSSQNNKMLVFGLTFNFWWLAALVDGFKTNLLPLSSQKNKMLIFGLRSTSDEHLGLVWWTLNTIHHLSPAKKIKCSLLDYV